MESWQDVMYASMRSARGSTVMKALTAVYYVSWIFIGNFILLNLFLAILLDSFSREENKANTEVDSAAELRAQQQRQQRLNDYRKTRMKKLKT